MSVPHDAIPWVLDGGRICHAIAAIQHGWYSTACSLFTTGRGETREPKRKCRKCVAMLRTATLRKEAP